MAITDRQRTELHKACEEAMGPGPADTLMASLPPVGWADVATKHDLAELERRIDLRFEGLEERLDLRFEALELKFDAKLQHGLKDLSTKFFLGLLTSNATLAGLAFGAARLMG